MYLRNTIKTCIVYDSKVLAYGILGKYEDDYEYFQDVTRRNRLNLQMSLDQSSNQGINYSFKLNAPDLFAPNKLNFQYSAAFLFATNGLILIIGCLYGYVKWKKNHTKQKLIDKFDNCMV